MAFKMTTTLEMVATFQIMSPLGMEVKLEMHPLEVLDTEIEIAAEVATIEMTAQLEIPATLEVA